MLSNLSFTVVMALDGQEGVVYLVLRLLPRSVSGVIEIAKVQDLSFLLCLVQVNKFDDADAWVTLDTEATYGNNTRDSGNGRAFGWCK